MWKKRCIHRAKEDEEKAKGQRLGSPISVAYDRLLRARNDGLVTNRLSPPSSKAEPVARGTETSNSGWLDMLFLEKLSRLQHNSPCL